jgi:hypothetical protein
LPADGGISRTAMEIVRIIIYQHRPCQVVRNGRVEAQLLLWVSTPSINMVICRKLLLTGFHYELVQTRAMIS